MAVHGDRLLVVRRGHAPAAGLWTLPGGRLEPGELIVEGVARELAEETGLRGTVGPLCGIAERIGERHHFVIHDHWVTVDRPAEPVAGDDADDARWVTVEQLGLLPLVPGTMDFLAEHGVLDRMAAGRTA